MDHRQYLKLTQSSAVLRRGWIGRAYRFGSFFILGVLLVIYIGLTNSVSTQGYKLSALQAKIKSAERQMAVVNLEITAAQSMPRVRAEAEAIALQPISRIEYLASPGSSVAVR